MLFIIQYLSNAGGFERFDQEFCFLVDNFFRLDIYFNGRGTMKGWFCGFQSEYCLSSMFIVHCT